jgi:hypothetical protein
MGPKLLGGCTNNHSTSAASIKAFLIYLLPVISVIQLQGRKSLISQMHY